ncbi:energy-coupling factor transporter ATPase [Paucilactobacillus oligofermentans]|uniref:energy-coupling factor transporter ATPase n=1 Tax=Paucilactobacillus oligofermentans TaxID=293371 RepID=UPI00070A8FC7
MVVGQIEITNVDYKYQPDTPFESIALQEINFAVEQGTYTAVIGHTGSGKSTLIQLIDGLIKPTTGEVTVVDKHVTPDSSGKELDQLRKNVGIVFQFPESQLFEETVIKDIAFGPKNFGKSDTEANEIASRAMKLVGLSDDFAEKSPFDLSGGQMRRVAIAGVLALEPDILILDEPTAGLDAAGQEQIMTLFKELNVEHGITIILVTHNMEDVAKYADQVYVLNHGKIVKSGGSREIFADQQWLNDNYLTVPVTTRIAQKLINKGYHFDEFPLTVEELSAKLLPNLKGEK